MDWNRLDAHGRDGSAAFEALAGHLFEQFCRRKYGAALRDFRFVGGRGGDGGVEAYAVLASGDEVGLQAKWFRNAFGPKQIAQVDESFRSAIANHPRLVGYLVAVPRNLADVRDKPSRGASGGRPREKTERSRWNDWKAAAKTRPPGIEPELWDEAVLEGHLSESVNEGLRAYWFTDAVIRHDDLVERFIVARHGWLALRYLPDLHAAGALEQQLALRLGEPAARRELLRDVRAAIDELTELRDEVTRLANYPAFLRADADASARQDAALEALGALLVIGEEVALAVRTGGAVGKRPAFAQKHEDSLRRLHDVLKSIPPNPGLTQAPTHDILERLQRSLWENNAPLPILRAWTRWERCSKIAAFVGPPGIGKTHALVHAVETRLNAGEPSLLLRAKDCPLDEGWAGILRRALDRPTCSLGTLLDAFESLAVRADVAHARSPSSACVEAADLDRGPTRFLLAIDALDECGRHERWAELLGELAGYMERRPRIRVAVTLRTASSGAILCRAKREEFDTIAVPRGDGEVQRLLDEYCAHYMVEPPDRRLRWAINDPLGVRLYCEVAGVEPRWGLRRQNLSLPKLLEAKLSREEQILREKGGWSEHIEPLQRLLSVVTSAYARHGHRVPREQALAAAEDVSTSRGVLTQEKWDWVFERAAEAGFLLCTKEVREGPDVPTISYVEPAFEPLTDYLIAKAACEESFHMLARGENPKLNARLARRPDALTYTAILLAQRGVYLHEVDLWTADMPVEERESIQLSAIAALDDDDVGPYADWVRSRLVGDLKSCRRVLTDLCVPVARDEKHPFGPRFVHEALLPFLPAKRDLFWSGPSYRAGDGGAAEGTCPGALEVLEIRPDDRADGAPLLLAWALTSVDSLWRRRLRAELARWGAARLDDLVLWLGFAIETNDPQMAEDVAMIAYGAACLASADSNLGALAAWADKNLLAPDARHRREDVVVLHAARGIVERASFMGASVDPAALAHTKLVYSSKPGLLSIDVLATKKADNHHGVRPITHDLAWYVVPRAIEPFFGMLDLYVTPPRNNRRAWDIVAEHAAATGIDELTPQKLAFGAISAHLNVMGCHQEIALGRRYEPETHGARSPVCSLVEKYVWTGRHALQAYFAARAPASVSCANGSDTHAEPPVTPSFIASLVPNPASDAVTCDISAGASWSFSADDELAPMIDLKPGHQADMADEWVKRAPRPNIQKWLAVSSATSGAHAPVADWLVLSCVATATERRSQADSILRVSSFVVPHGAPRVLKREGDTLFTSARRHLAEFGEVVRGATYGDPFDAAWAPWATGSSATDDLDKGLRAHIDIEPAIAGLTWECERGDAQVRLPAEWLRRALDLVGIEHHFSAMRREYRFVDRRGSVQAVYLEESSGRGRYETLAVREGSLRRALTVRKRALVWSAWLYRWPNPHLFDHERERTKPYVDDHWEWLAFLTSRGVDVEELRRYQPPT